MTYMDEGCTDQATDPKGGEAGKSLERQAFLEIMMPTRWTETNLRIKYGRASESTKEN